MKIGLIPRTKIFGTIAGSIFAITTPSFSQKTATDTLTLKSKQPITLFSKIKGSPILNQFDKNHNRRIERKEEAEFIKDFLDKAKIVYGDTSEQYKNIVKTTDRTSFTFSDDIDIALLEYDKSSFGKDPNYSLVVSTKDPLNKLVTTENYYSGMIHYFEHIQQLQELADKNNGKIPADFLKKMPLGAEVSADLEQTFFLEGLQKNGIQFYKSDNFQTYERCAGTDPKAMSEEQRKEFAALVKKRLKDSGQWFVFKDGNINEFKTLENK